MKRARLPGGPLIWCDAALGVGAVWNEIQSYFPVAERVRAGETVFDVGANIGLFSLAAWRQSEGRAQIYSFEPMPSTCAICEVNARAFDPCESNWHTLRAGLGARDEVAVFHHFPSLSVLSGRVRDRQRAFQEMDRALAAPVLGAPLEAFNVLPSGVRRPLGMLVGQFLLRSRPVSAQVWTLSHVLKKLNVARVDWLKIDVEGAELDVLRGVSRSDWPRIKRVLLEAENAEQEREARELLQDVGFEVQTCDNPVFSGHELKMLFARRLNGSFEL